MKNLSAKTSNTNNTKKSTSTKQYRTGSFISFSDDLFCNGIDERIGSNRLHIDGYSHRVVRH